MTTTGALKNAGASTAAIFGGLATSAPAAFGVAGDPLGRIVVVIAGLLAGLAAGINQFMKPARRAVAYRRAALELEREAWLFILGLAPYDADPDRSWQRFARKVLQAEAGDSNHRATEGTATA